MNLTKSQNPFQKHKKTFPVSYSFVEITEFANDIISDELPMYVKVDFYQTSKFVPSSFYKPITSGLAIKRKNNEKSI